MLPASALSMQLCVTEETKTGSQQRMARVLRMYSLPLSSSCTTASFLFKSCKTIMLLVSTILNYLSWTLSRAALITFSSLSSFQPIVLYPRGYHSTMASQPTSPPPFGDMDALGGLLATTILVTVLCVILIALRFAIRICIVKRVGCDDWCILFAGVRVSLLCFHIQCWPFSVWTSDRDRACCRPTLLQLRQTRILHDLISISRVL